MCIKSLFSAGLYICAALQHVDLLETRSAAATCSAAGALIRLGRVDDRTCHDRGAHV